MTADSEWPEPAKFSEKRPPSTSEKGHFCHLK